MSAEGKAPFMTTGVGIRWHKLIGGLLWRVTKYTSGKEGNGRGGEMICMQPAGVAGPRKFPDRSLPGYINSSRGMADGLQLTGAKT